MDVFAELHLNERFKVKIENIVEELNLVEEFKERLNILQNKLLIVPPTDIKLNLISHGQQQADEAIGGKKETNGLIKAVFFEEGSVVIGCTFENDHVFLIPADITDEQKIYIQQMIDTVKETRASIVLGFVEKNVYLENNTIKDCDVSLVGSTKKKNWRWFSS